MQLRIGFGDSAVPSVQIAQRDGLVNQHDWDISPDRIAAPTVFTDERGFQRSRDGCAAPVGQSPLTDTPVEPVEEVCFGQVDGLPGFGAHQGVE